VRSVPGVIGVTTELKVRQRDDVSRRSIVEFFPR
jgi:hypothetical protein